MQVVLDRARMGPACPGLECPLESVIAVRGRLVERPVHARRATASADPREVYEVIAEDVQVLNEATHQPFGPFDAALPAEERRLADRFVDLRRPELQAGLRLRAEVNHWIRTHLRARGFLEVETPLLFRSTPEGAREFLVPTGAQRAYALPQSPQQFKQMLMAAGVDRYYQLARCFRNEDGRADRQPEFTQLDLEMAFASQASVMAELEAVVTGVLRAFRPADCPDQPIDTMTYDRAMRTYGSDKPDTRYAFALETVSEDGEGVTECLDLSAVPASLRPTQEAVVRRVRRPGDRVGTTALGRVRQELIRRIEDAGLQARYRLEGASGLLWVTRFPLFAVASGDAPLRRLEPLHHPFTAPEPSDAHLVERDPLAVHGQHYDLVWRGTEIAGGSIRIHDARLQEHVLRSVLGLSDAAVGHFDHLLRALRSGCPPHGGIALGLDRFLAMLLGAPSIRDVIAFPKNSQGTDVCVGAPS